MKAQRSTSLRVLTPPQIFESHPNAKHIKIRVHAVKWKALAHTSRELKFSEAQSDHVDEVTRIAR